tara:strand:- start:357 stop:1514 length:1158 start_codon:yes stop_codon:yes gene_type:complete
MSNYGFKLKEYENRLEKAQSLMHLNQIDILLITSEQFMRYFTGFSTQFWQSPTRPWYLIIPIKGLPKAVIPDIGLSAMQKTWIKEIYTWPSPRPKDEGISLISKLMKEFPSKFNYVGAELGKEMSLRMPLTDFFFLQSTLSRKIIDASSILWELRLIKSNAEIDKIKHICKISSNSFENLPSLINKGDSERDIAKKMKMDLISQGADSIPYLPVISGVGGVSQIIYEPTNRVLKSGDILFIDTGSTYDGYFCDFDRNYSIGEASKIVNDIYEILWVATQNAIEGARPGLFLSDLWKLMANSLNKYLPNNFNKGRFGHSFGLQLTEPPSITFNNNMKLEPNMVLTLEPSIEFTPGKMLVHEENIVIRENGAELLTSRAPYKIVEIN